MPIPRQAADGNEHDLRPIVLESLHDLWYRMIVSNLRDAASSRLLPPMEVTSTPLPVRSIWGAYDHRREALLYSSFTHAILVIFLLVLSSSVATRSFGTHSIGLNIPVDLSESIVWLRARRSGGGGGKHAPLPSSRGSLLRFEVAPIAAPAVVEKNADPKLPVPPALVGPEDFELPRIEALIWGDPLGVIGPPSDGSGSSGGIGGGTVRGSALVTVLDQVRGLEEA